MKTPICPYCRRAARLVTGADIYQNRQDLKRLWFWKCYMCDAYVGCHKKGALKKVDPRWDGKVPLGTLANAELRMWRSRAHREFDPLWREQMVFRSRAKAYKWLREAMNLLPWECHIGKMEVWQCKEVIELSEERFEAYIEEQRELAEADEEKDN